MHKHYIANMVLYMHLDCILLHIYQNEKYEVGAKQVVLGATRTRVKFYI
jgi:hypothetical protein